MQINLKIKNDYAHYEELMAAIKNTTLSPFFLLPKVNNKAFVVGEVPVVHPTVAQAIVLLAEMNANHRTHFGLKLRAQYLCDEPFFRFDSEGPAHRNDIDAIPLPQRQVSTPHFHRFNSDGIMIAYKTNVLLDPAQVTAIKGDINLGLALFSQESNVRCPKNGYPEATEQTLPLKLPADNGDPLAGKSFSQ